MTAWMIDKNLMVEMILEINRLGQKMLNFDGEIHGIYFSSRIADIALDMLGLPHNSRQSSVPAKGSDRSDKEAAPSAFRGGLYHCMFNHPSKLALGCSGVGPRQLPDIS